MIFLRFLLFHASSFDDFFWGVFCCLLYWCWNWRNIPRLLNVPHGCNFLIKAYLPPSDSSPDYSCLRSKIEFLKVREPFKMFPKSLKVYVNFEEGIQHALRYEDISLVIIVHFLYIILIELIMYFNRHRLYYFFLKL